MSTPIACRALNDYTLWLEFDDGLRGRIYLGNLLEIGAFQCWRELSAFHGAYVDRELGVIAWRCGVRLDAEVLWRDLAARKKWRGNFFDPIKKSHYRAEFERFMARACGLGPRKGRSR